MKIRYCCVLLLFVSLLALTACSWQAVTPTPIAMPPGYQSFTSERYGLRVDYPADLELRHSFARSYLAADGWKTYMGPDAPPGRALLALVMPQSNSVTRGELRVGVSRDPAALESCTHLPSAARLGSGKQVMISGVPFTAFTAADGAMSHYLNVKSFRGVHAGTCYAVDVLVVGTNPQVYDPPKTPPFSRQDVFDRLLPVAMNLHLLAASAPIAPPATYTGLLPCADCPGIEYQLNLLAGHRYQLRMDYQDRDAVYDSQGRWYLLDGGKKLVLRVGRDGASSRQWTVLDNGRRLHQMGSSGRPVSSKLNYELRRQTQFEPLDSGGG